MYELHRHSVSSFRLLMYDIYIYIWGGGVVRIMVENQVKGYEILFLANLYDNFICLSDVKLCSRIGGFDEDFLFIEFPYYMKKLGFLIPVLFIR
jgi:hypothetical protein